VIKPKIFRTKNKTCVKTKNNGTGAIVAAHAIHTTQENVQTRNPFASFKIFKTAPTRDKTNAKS
jgi:hypothetical protein